MTCVGFTSGSMAHDWSLRSPPLGGQGAIARASDLARSKAYPPSVIRWRICLAWASTAPVLIIVADFDGACPVHAVAMVRPQSGGVFGDLAGLSDAQLAVLRGVTHVGLVDRAEWLLAMAKPSLDAPLTESS